MQCTLCTHIHIYKYAYIYTCKQTYSMCTYINICIHTYIYIPYIYIYIWYIAYILIIKNYRKYNKAIFMGPKNSCIYLYSYIHRLVYLNACEIIIEIGIQTLIQCYSLISYIQTLFFINMLY